MAQAIEEMAARIGQMQATLNAQVQTIQAQASRINVLESQSASHQLLTERMAHERKDG